MPDGERTNLKFYNLISKLFTFFKCKNSKHNNNDLETQEYWLHYSNLKAEDVMIPRVDIIAVDSKSSLDKINSLFVESRHTRMPIYNEELDNIIGFINIKDVFPYIANPKKATKFDINDIIRKPLIISQSMKIITLLEEMKKSKIHIAIVVDEFGGVDGLITIEDLIEEIIGKIEDEHDLTEYDIKDVGDGKFEASGRTELESLEEKLNLELVDENKCDTLGGLILSITGYVPEKGEKITHYSTGLMFEILDSDPRRIKTVLISNAQKSFDNNLN
ncbi:MAG: hemolysin family protein [Pseudomonadota bacterium]